MTAAWTPTDREVHVLLATDALRAAGRLVTLDGDGVTLDPDAEVAARDDSGDWHAGPDGERVTVTWPEVRELSLFVEPPPVRVPVAPLPHGLLSVAQDPDPDPPEAPP